MSSGLEPIYRLIRAVQRRERLADAAQGLARVALPSGLGLAAVAVTLSRLFCLPLSLAWVATLPVPAVIAWAYLRPRSARATARRIDAHYGLYDRLGNALELSNPKVNTGSTDPRSREIADLFVADATRGVSELSAAPVVPIGVPGLRRLDLLVVVLLGATFLIPEAALCPEPPPSETDREGLSPTETAAAANPMDLALAEPLRQDLRELEDGKDTPARIASAILDVLDALEKGELDRAEAFAMLEQLDQELREAEQAMEESLEEDPWLLGEAMRDLAEVFEKHEITEEVAEALERGDSLAAEEALKKAMEAAEKEGGELQDALDAAMKDAERSLGKNAGKNTDTASQLAEEERRLKRQQKREAADPEEQERRLKRQQERLDQLRRQHEREKAAQRALDQLRRQAQQSRTGKQAGQQGQQQQQQGQQGQQGQQRQQGQQGQQQGRRGGQRQFRQGMKNASQKSSSARRMGSARDSLEEAKTFVRRSGKQGQGEQRRKQQQRQFGKRAKGKKGKDGKGKGDKGKSTLLVEGKVGDGPPDMVMETDQPGDVSMESQGQNGQPSQSPSTGDQAGDGSMEALGDPNEMDSQKKNVRVDARHGRGATRAEVISTASQEGFASQSYKRVYQDYEAFAQSAMDSETMPAGKRRRVKRYFQMIQPRD